MSQHELETLWVNGHLPTAKLQFDDRVKATSGEHEGKGGRVVALLEIEPTPLYVIEELGGTSFNATQPELEREKI